MQDCFIIYYNDYPLVCLTHCEKFIQPDPDSVLSWYAEHFDFDRSRLTGAYCHSYDMTGMQYKNFFEKRTPLS